MIEVEDQLSNVTQPTLVLSGRYDRVCSVEAADAIHSGIKNSRIKIFEESAHMSFVEENKQYIKTIRTFLHENLK